MPTVSIIIPAYNQAQYLREAIDSALAQSYQDREIIVVNDGSADATAQIADSFGDAIRVIHQANQGLAGARNSGIDAAQGAWIGLLDSDDSWEPDCLARLFELVSQHPNADVAYCAARCIDADGKQLVQIAGQRVPSATQFRAELVRANWLIPSTMLIRKATLQAHGNFDPAIRASEDWDMWLRMTASGSQFVGTLEPLVRYRLHGSSLSADPVNMHRAVRQVVEKNFGLEDGNWTPEKRMAFGSLYRYCAVTSLLRLGDWDATATHLHAALNCDASLASDLDLFYELALGDQTLGKRGSEFRPISAVAPQMQRLIEKATAGENAHLRPAVTHTANHALGLVAYNSQQPSRPYLWQSLKQQPFSSHSAQLIQLYLKSFFKRAQAAPAQQPA